MRLSRLPEQHIYARLRLFTAVVIAGASLATPHAVADGPSRSVTTTEQSADTRSESPRDRILRLLLDIHSDDAAVAQTAGRALFELGITADQLRYARLLKHPSRDARLELVHLLGNVPQPLRTELHSELLRDADADVREAAARINRGSSPSPSATGPVFSADVPPSNLLQLTAVQEPAAAPAATDQPAFDGELRPEILNRPIEPQILPTAPPEFAEETELLTLEMDPPRGFTGPSGILSPDVQEDSHFVPVPDRWRLGYPRTDRYGASYPWTVDYIGVPGHWWDPYNQNVLKGDFPIIGQHIFMNLTATSQTLFDYRQVPTPTTPFESTRSANQTEFFGEANQHLILQNFFLRFDLFHGAQTAFRPLDWQIRLAPAFNVNALHVNELSVVNPDTRDGRDRIRDHSILLQEYFVEAKLADLSPDYDFVSARAGNQLFNSDFRGFIFFDTNRAVRLFGTRVSNRHQFNLIWFDMVEKDTNSGLNTNHDRHQNVLMANYYIQDFVFPGYTFQTSFHMNNDQPSREFDRNSFLVRPDPAGVALPHRVESYYFGVAGDGHMGRINVSNAFYWVTGRDGLNPIAGQPMDIDAYMAALELSYDRDWARFRASFFYSSGDSDPSDRDGEGFDAIMDNPVFAGGEFSYWQRQAIQLFGVRLVNDRSLVPNMRSSKTQGQSNFTNPGLLLFNLGFDADITPKLRMITNANYLMFDETAVLETFTFQGDVDQEIGLDLSMGFEWRPFHNDNMIALFGVSTLIPDEGFKDLYSEFNSGDVDPLYAGFFELILTY
ncbi:MAG: HEAT repeat domain-containing protein [Planctomycetota bacterium]